MIVDYTTAHARAQNLHRDCFAMDGIKKVIARMRQEGKDVIGFGDTWEDALAQAAGILEREHQRRVARRRERK